MLKSRIEVSGILRLGELISCLRGKIYLCEKSIFLLSSAISLLKLDLLIQKPELIGPNARRGRMPVRSYQINRSHRRAAQDGRAMFNGASALTGFGLPYY